ncbi:MAG: ATP-dependent helicase, partial [Planctomycetes bacterium]|nr:ATP-dependent helicase [Planctomycetota bacterium]
IGDPDQAIYSFRGSDAACFQSFESTFPGAAVIELKDNYRCTVNIVHASGQLIHGNKEQAAGALPSPSGKEKGVLLEQRILPTDRAEAAYVAHRIEALTGGMGRYGLEGGPGQEDDREEFGFGEIAVLYRLNAQAPLLAQALENAGIPIQQVGTRDKGFDPVMRWIAAAAQWMAKPGNPAVRRKLQSLMDRRKARKTESEFLDMLRCRVDKDLFYKAAQALSLLSPDLMQDLEEAAEKLEARRQEEGLEPVEFLARVSLLQREDPFEAKSEKVTLSTLHAAKGLEFPVVFIAGLEEGIVPFIREDEENRKAALEEERRLLYVGMTRAQSELYLSHAKKRFLFGRRLSGEPSPFLADISEDLIQFKRETTKPKKKKKDDGQMQLF